MSRRLSAQKVVFVIFGLGAVLLAAAGVSWAERVSITPHRIVLNAKGQFDGIDAIVGIVLPSARILDFEATLSLVVEDDDGNGAEIVIAMAQAVRYCVIDYNLFLTFDRETIQTHPEIIARAGQSVRCKVDGSVTIDGIDQEFCGYDVVEIHAPGR